jgi:error-prone DNA polymerase
LNRTLGVPLFQEQVMQIAIAGAGYTGGEADQLRRDMAAWRRTGSLERHRTRLARGFAERGISKEFSERLYQQIHGFAEYGFPESHASSFALLVYASSWLKVHHPAEFAAALINSQPMGFYSVSTILQDAQKHGVEVRPISIDRSEWDCTIEREDDGAAAIRVGLRQIQGLGEATAKHIEAARSVSPFRSIEDLAFRASLEKDELQVLAESGALEPLVGGRRDAMWKVHAPHSPRGSLFAGTELGDPLPKFPPLGRAAQLVLDYESTGLSISDHPMLLLRPRLPKRAKSARELGEVPHGRPASVAGLVICRQRPGTASGVVFITMEDETGFINLILYARIFDKFRHVATTSSLLMAHGKTERDGDVLYVIVEHLEPIDENRFPSMSRDFH